jgi:hypothetical protein
MLSKNHSFLSFLNTHICQIHNNLKNYCSFNNYVLYKSGNYNLYSLKAYPNEQDSVVKQPID